MGGQGQRPNVHHPGRPASKRTLRCLLLRADRQVCRQKRHEATLSIPSQKHQIDFLQALASLPSTQQKGFLSVTTTAIEEYRWCCIAATSTKVDLTPCTFEQDGQEVA